MPEPFKNLFNPSMIGMMADHLTRAEKEFDRERFISEAIANLESLELKERSRQIQHALEASLPNDYRRSCETLLASLHPDSDVDLSNTDMDALGIRGWAIMPMADFVASRGLDDFDFSMDVLKEMSKRFTSELAIRLFFLEDSERALNHVRRWACDPNFHVRRLASEGSRPRLPWALRLPVFINDPAPILSILELMKDDPEEYVRRSIANNLNDISKDHPDLVANTASRWMKNADNNRKRLIRHGCRTLIKQGHKATLGALGYSEPKLSFQELVVKTSKVTMGEHLEFGISLKSETKQSQPLIIDYVIHHRKANGGTSPKVFKWKVTDLPARETVDFKKKHAFKPIATRVYYPGEHHLEIQINGQSFAQASFELKL